MFGILSLHDISNKLYNKTFPSSGRKVGQRPSDLAFSVQEVVVALKEFDQPRPRLRSRPRPPNAGDASKLEAKQSADADADAPFFSSNPSDDSDPDSDPDFSSLYVLRLSFRCSKALVVTLALDPQELWDDVPFTPSPPHSPPSPPQRPPPPPPLE